MKEGRRQILRLHAAIAQLTADLVGRAENLSAADPAAGEGHRKDAAPAIAPATRIDFRRPRIGLTDPSRLASIDSVLST
jgi:hypothetical protein